MQVIRQDQDIGFSLAETAELLSLGSDPGAGCADVRTRAIKKRNDVQVKIDRLSRMRDALDVLIARCPSEGDLKTCTILDVMERGIDNDHTSGRRIDLAAS